jgi:hypothetical protein
VRFTFTPRDLLRRYVALISIGVVENGKPTTSVMSQAVPCTYLSVRGDYMKVNKCRTCQQLHVVDVIMY